MITIFSTVAVMRTILSRSVATVSIVAGLGVGLAACGTDDASDAAGPRIVVTTSILGDVVEHLVSDRAAVEVVMPPNADPHDFAPSAKQAEAMRTADLLVINGGGFEAGLVDTIEAAEADGAPVVRATEAVDPLPFVEQGEEANDPHVFTSPANMVLIAETIADRLAEEVSSLETPAFRSQVEAYVNELRALDAEVGDVLSVVPQDQRVLVTNHDVFGYFAERYDFEILGALIPAGTTLAEPSSKGINDLAALIAEAGVPAIFADTSSPSRVADALAGEGIGVEGVELFSESRGEPGSGGETYIDLMRTNAERIAAALD